MTIVIKEEKNIPCPAIETSKTAERMKKLLKEKNLTVKDVQAYLGLANPQAVYYWLNGRCMPTIDNLYALSELLDVSVDYIICGNRQAEYRFVKEETEQICTVSQK